MRFDDIHCRECGDRPFRAYHDFANGSVLVSTGEIYPEDKKEQFKLKLEGVDFSAETYFCQTCSAWETVQHGRVIQRGYFER